MKAIKAVAWIGLMMFGSFAGGVRLAGGAGARAGMQLAGKPAAASPGGQATPGPAPGRVGDAVVARVNGVTIQRQQLESLLIESHGLNTLLSLVQLELARQAAEEKKIVVTQADFDAERHSTLARLFLEYDTDIDDKVAVAAKAGKKDEVAKLEKERLQGHDQLLGQFLTQERISSGEFDVVLRINAYLRKVAEPLLVGKITEEMLMKQFGARYGEQVSIRHIQLSRVQDARAVKSRLAAGEDFAKVASDVSTNKQTALQGGRVGEFSRTTHLLPQNFKDAAFALQEGQVSEIVEADHTYHLIKLEKRIAPKAVKYEDMKPIIYRDLHEQYVQAIIKELRARIGELARQSLKIDEPTLRKQYEEKLALLKPADPKKAALTDLEKERERQAAAAATQPIGPPAPPIPPGPVTTRPVATQPAAAALSIQERIDRLYKQRMAEIEAARGASTAPATRPATAPASALK